MADEMTTHRVWDKQQNETPKAYAAFQRYLSMPLVGEGTTKRSLQNLADALGYASPSTIEAWSTRNDWQARSQAYDAHVGSMTMTVRETSIKEYQQSVVSRMATQIAALDRIIEKKLASMLTLADADLFDKEGNSVPAGVDGTELKKVVDAMHKKDDLARRIGGMATQFSIVAADEEPDGNTVYIIGE